MIQSQLNPRAALALRLGSGNRWDCLMHRGLRRTHETDITNSRLFYTVQPLTVCPRSVAASAGN
jgi:hypothetical protein